MVRPHASEAREQRRRIKGRTAVCQREHGGAVATRRSRHPAMVDTSQRAMLIHQEVVMYALGNSSHNKMAGPP